MKILLSIALLSSLVLASTQTIASSNSKTNNYSLSIDGSIKNLALNSVNNNLVGTWINGGTKQYTFYADGTFVYMTSMQIYTGCGRAKAYVQMGNFQLFKGGINFQPTSARLKTWQSCSGMVLSEGAAAKGAAFSAYATLQNNGQILTLVRGGRSTSYQKSAK